MHAVCKIAHGKNIYLNSESGTVKYAESPKSQIRSETLMHLKGIFHHI